MIKEIRYKNFKALRDATLPLGRFTLIVGANGTGKSTALQVISHIEKIDYTNIVSNLTKGLNENNLIEIEMFWDNFSSRKTVPSDNKPSIIHYLDKNQNILGGSSGSFINTIDWTYKHNEEADALRRFKVFAFDADKIAEATILRSNIEIESNGANLAGVLWQIQSSEPEIFDELNKELQRWFPEFDRVVFEIPEDGKVSFLLRTKTGKHKIKAADLSDGTRLALAYLTIAYLPNPPKIVAFEEPERGIHPRLLQKIQESMDRLAYPENYGEKREPIQVIATTHSPYLLDLYKDRREEIVIADKDENGVRFERLTDLPNIEKILQEQDAPLGDIWFSGILGGVPAQL
jgi:predicted ATPase